ncbi:L-2-amino-thiazoline-4-carboxylic acid hydrolase [Vallitalea guaymasensis]|uniref:L-2-amino-thiazoline-4-carboxylic acid hydrolase n=1 Tax=Vallitalea guaymasensis TaxID=1185412 RepID=UPI00187D544B|nr:L-2-amino-thiazoline-4-carboxylic acid hydrolase [Vallitalea guaymasensis]
MNHNKILKKSSMNYILYEGQLCGNKELIRKTERRLGELIEKHDLSNKKMVVHMKKAILPSIAVYKEMLEFGYPREKSIEAIKESAIIANKGMASFFGFIGKMPFGYAIFRKMCPMAIKNGFCKPGWNMKWISNNSKTMEFHAKSCLYVDIMKQENCLELVPIFCQVDDYMYGNMKNIIWDRKKTLGYGDKVCDFRFFKRS